MEAWLGMGYIKGMREKYILIALFLVLVFLIANIGQRAPNTPQQINGTIDVEFMGDVYSESLEVLDNTGYTIHILLCSLADENVAVNITPEKWIDKRAVTYVLLPPGSYPPGFLKDIPQEVGRFRIINATISNFSYKKGTIIYRGHLKKSECTVLSIRAIFKKVSLPRRISAKGLGFSELDLPDATLMGGNGSYRLKVWIPWDYGNWSLSILVPKRLGRNETYRMELEEYLSSMLSGLKKGIQPLNALKRPNSKGPEPPDSYCAELSASGDLVYTQRPLDESPLYSDGTYFETDFYGNSSKMITLNISAKGCSPAVWLIFRGKAKTFLTGPFLSLVQIKARGPGIVCGSKIEIVDEIVVEPIIH